MYCRAFSALLTYAFYLHLSYDSTSVSSMCFVLFCFLTCSFLFFAHIIQCAMYNILIELLWSPYTLVNVLHTKVGIFAVLLLSHAPQMRLTMIVVSMQAMETTCCYLLLLFFLLLSMPGCTTCFFAK